MKEFKGPVRHLNWVESLLHSLEVTVAKVESLGIQYVKQILVVEA